MSQPYVGEIRMFGGNFAPAGWISCQGQLLPISEFDVLFQLIGTTYGGDGESTFALPDLRGRIPLHQGNGFTLGQAAGAEEITLTVNQIHAHSHAALASTATAGAATPVNNLPAQPSTARIYNAPATAVAMAPSALSSGGGSQPHTNLQPYLCIDFIISVYGLFPSPS